MTIEIETEHSLFHQINDTSCFIDVFRTLVFLILDPLLQKQNQTSHRTRWLFWMELGGVMEVNDPVKHSATPFKTITGNNFQFLKLLTFSLFKDI